MTRQARQAFIGLALLVAIAGCKQYNSPTTQTSPASSASTPSPSTGATGTPGPAAPSAVPDQPSRWGISYGGIWVTHDQDVAQAKALMADYQAQRRTRVREERASAVREGSADTFASVLRREPVRVVLTLLAILALLGLVALVPLLLSRH